MKNKNQNLVIEYKGILSYLQFKKRGMPDSQRYPWNLFKNWRSTSCSWVELRVSSIFETPSYTDIHTVSYTDIHTVLYTDIHTFKHFFQFWDWTIFASFETGQFLQVFPMRFDPAETALNKWIKYYNIFLNF